MTTNRRPWSFIAVLVLTLAACSGATGVPSSVVPGTGLAVTAVAGPTCPVETVGDPACAPRPVAGATVNILDGGGTSVATVVLDAKGAAIVPLPAGNYVVQARPAAGLMATPGPMNVTVVDGTLTRVVLSYDTGIR